MSVESPCISVCQIDHDSGYCTGCGRSLDEIRGWKKSSDDQKAEIRDRAEGRLAQAEA